MGNRAACRRKPKERNLFGYILHVAHEDGRSLGAGGVAAGDDGGSSTTIDEALGLCPLHGGQRPWGNVCRVGVGSEVVCLGHVILLVVGVTQKHGRHLLACNVVSRTEQAAAVAVDNNAVLAGPDDGVGVPLAACHISKGIRGGNGGFTLQTVENGDQHGAIQRPVGVKLVVAHAVHQIVVIGVLDTIQRPVVVHVCKGHSLSGGNCEGTQMRHGYLDIQLAVNLDALAGERFGGAVA